MQGEGVSWEKQAEGNEYGNRIDDIWSRSVQIYTFMIDSDGHGRVFLWHGMAPHI